LNDNQRLKFYGLSGTSRTRQSNASVKWHG